MLLSTDNQGTGVDLIVPDIVLIVALSWVSILFVCDLLSHTGSTQYSATEQVRASADILIVLASEPQVV